jgi:hypothetical protein
VTTVYSALLADLPAGAPGDYVFGPPPVGKRWIVVCIDAVNYGGGIGYVYGFKVADSAGVDLFSIGPPYAQRSFPYHWEGRHVLDNPQTLDVHLVEANWAVRVSGYVLSLP